MLQKCSAFTSQGKNRNVRLDDLTNMSRRSVESADAQPTLKAPSPYGGLVRYAVIAVNRHHRTVFTEILQQKYP